MASSSAFPSPVQLKIRLTATRFLVLSYPPHRLQRQRSDRRHHCSPLSEWATETDSARRACACPNGAARYRNQFTHHQENTTNANPHLQVMDQCHQGLRIRRAGGRLEGHLRPYLSCRARRSRHAQVRPARDLRSAARSRWVDLRRGGGGRRLRQRIRDVRNPDNGDLAQELSRAVAQNTRTQFFCLEGIARRDPLE